MIVVALLIGDRYEHRDPSISVYINFTWSPGRNLPEKGIDQFEDVKAHETRARIGGPKTIQTNLNISFKKVFQCASSELGSSGSER